MVPSTESANRNSPQSPDDHVRLFHRQFWPLFLAMAVTHFVLFISMLVVFDWLKSPPLHVIGDWPSVLRMLQFSVIGGVVGGGLYTVSILWSGRIAVSAKGISSGDPRKRTN